MEPLWLVEIDYRLTSGAGNDGDAGETFETVKVGARILAEVGSLVEFPIATIGEIRIRPNPARVQPATLAAAEAR